MEKKADVILAANEDTGIVLLSVRAVLEHSGTALHRLILVDSRSSSPETATALAGLTTLGSSVEVLCEPARLGLVGLYNRGIDASQNDVVLLRCGIVVGTGWLRELALVAHSDERTASASPPPEYRMPRPAMRRGRVLEKALDQTAALRASAGLPRFTVTPALDGSCIYLRRDRIDAIGLLDAGLDDVDAAIDDWINRAGDLGFVAKRANRVYACHAGPPVEEALAAVGIRSDGAARDERHRRFDRQGGPFRSNLDENLVAHAIRIEATEKLRIAYDLRHLPVERVGTRTYALCLGSALGELPDIELSLLVRSPGQARGLKGRVVIEDDWTDDVEVIHKPAQVTDPAELKLLFGSGAHVVITYQDMIGYRVPLAFPTDESFESYRVTSNLASQAAQKLVAISRVAAAEIAADFGIPRDEIAVVYHGVESSWFAHRRETDPFIRRRLDLPDDYFFSLATDFPHKNLCNLLDAYALLRSRWTGADPPRLVLAGYTSNARAGFYSALELGPSTQGVTFLGPVKPEELRVLYQQAMAFVFPSLYEGFGLTPLESMAAGTPVIAMPISAVPEVAGDCALYPGNLSARALALAMERMAIDRDLREGLRARGLEYVDKFRWENTARATAQVYRSAVLHPSERALRTRRLLRDAILRWSGAEMELPPAPCVAESLEPVVQQSIGIRNAWMALNCAISARLKREIRRLALAPGVKARASRRAALRHGMALPRKRAM